eukprot:6071586-Prymnesium_polylepis.1
MPRGSTCITFLDVLRRPRQQPVPAASAASAATGGGATPAANDSAFFAILALVVFAVGAAAFYLRDRIMSDAAALWSAAAPLLDEVGAAPRSGLPLAGSAAPPHRGRRRRRRCACNAPNAKADARVSPRPCVCLAGSGVGAGAVAGPDGGDAAPRGAPIGGGRLG